LICDESVFPRGLLGRPRASPRDIVKVEMAEYIDFIEHEEQVAVSEIEMQGWDVSRVAWNRWPTIRL
jgi:hypothetical protein